MFSVFAPHSVGIATPLVLVGIGIAFGGSTILGRLRQPREAGSTVSRLSIAGIAIQSAGFAAVGMGRLKIRPEIDTRSLVEVAIVILLCGGAFAIFRAARTAMGANWSLVARTRTDHGLVTHGPFAHVRHPIYVALFLFVVGLAVALGHWGNLVVAIPLFWIGTLIRTSEEERLLRAHFGAAYDIYALRVKRFVPGVI